MKLYLYTIPVIYLFPLLFTQFAREIVNIVSAWSQPTSAACQCESNLQTINVPSIKIFWLATTRSPFLYRNLLMFHSLWCRWWNVQYQNYAFRYLCKDVLLYSSFLREQVQPNFESVEILSKPKETVTVLPNTKFCYSSVFTLSWIVFITLILGIMTLEEWMKASYKMSYPLTQNKIKHMNKIKCLTSNHR